MRVLWFSNTPANGVRYFESDLRSSGGWLQALDQAIQDKVELHVAFYCHRQVAPYRIKQTTYHPILYGNRYVEFLRSRFLNFVRDTEDQEVYLRLINEIKADVIHIHGTENPFGSIVGKTEVPIVISIQGNIAICRHKFFSAIEKRFLGVRNPTLREVKSVFLNGSFRSEYERFLKMESREARNLKNCRFVIGRTDWDRRITKVLAPTRRYFHNDEILRDEFYGPRWEAEREGKIVLHTTSGNGVLKGFETLCYALSELNERGLSVEWRVAGLSKNDSIVKTVKRKLKSRYPTQGLLLLGNIGASELVERLLEADIYVMPTHVENSSNSLCEAMMVGMPCIATFAGGTGSLLTDGKEGILIQDGDPWVLAGAILELLEEPERAARYGMMAQARAQIRHNRENIVADLLRIYDSLS